MHNALQQVTLRCGTLTLAGFSISGVATYVQVPELDLCFDMGECPLSAVPLRHVLLTHAHGDHARCLLRHRALRGMLGVPGEPCYVMPEQISASFHELARADATFEGVPEAAYVAPNVLAMSGIEGAIPLPHRPNTFVRAFPVDHRGVPSLGYTVLERRRKLKDEYAQLTGPEIAGLRRQGTEVSTTLDVPLITFIGDCVGHSLLDQAHIWASPVLVLEATFVDEQDREMAAAKGHTHIDEIGAAIARQGPDALPEHIVLKHFSMRVSRQQIDANIARAIPTFAHSRVRVFLD